MLRLMLLQKAMDSRINGDSVTGFINSKNLSKSTSQKRLPKSTSLSTMNNADRVRKILLVQQRSSLTFLFYFNDESTALFNLL